MTVSGYMLVLAVGEGTGGIVHGAYHIAGKGQRGVMGGCCIGHARGVVVPLGSVDGLHGHEVGPEAAPASWYGASVKVHEQMMTGGILKDIGIILNHARAVRQEEIHLDAGHAHLLKAGHLTLAGLGCNQTVLRSGGSGAYP